MEATDLAGGGRRGWAAPQGASNINGQVPWGPCLIPPKARANNVLSPSENPSLSLEAVVAGGLIRVSGIGGSRCTWRVCTTFVVETVGRHQSCGRASGCLFHGEPGVVSGKVQERVWCSRVPVYQRTMAFTIS